MAGVAIVFSGFADAVISAAGAAFNSRGRKAVDRLNESDPSAEGATFNFVENSNYNIGPSDLNILISIFQTTA